MINISLAKSYTKYGRETFTGPFSKNSKSNLSLDQQSETLYSLPFIMSPSGRLPKYIEIKVLTWRSGNSLPASFSA